MPIPAVDGVKLFPETPVPEYAPPAGAPAVRANAEASMQTEGMFPIITLGKGLMSMANESMYMHEEKVTVAT